MSKYKLNTIGLITVDRFSKFLHWQIPKSTHAWQKLPPHVHYVATGYIRTSYDQKQRSCFYWNTIHACRVAYKNVLNFYVKQNESWWEIWERKNKLCNYGLYSIRQTCAAVVISAVFTAILTHPTCIWRPSRGWHRSNFAEIFGIRKLESLSYRLVLYIFDPVINRFSKTPTCVRQTDTDRHRPMAITSHA